MPVPQEWWTRLNRMSRREIEAVLESISIQSYDTETIKELKEAVIANLEDGTLIPSDIGL